jgi:hypothetical protein
MSSWSWRVCKESRKGRASAQQLAEARASQSAPMQALPPHDDAVCFGRNEVLCPQQLPLVTMKVAPSGLGAACRVEAWESAAPSVGVPGRSCGSRICARAAVAFACLGLAGERRDGAERRKTAQSGTVQWVPCEYEPYGEPGRRPRRDCRAFEAAARDGLRVEPNRYCLSDKQSQPARHR